MKGRAITYTAEQRAWVKANCTLMRGELHSAFCARFGRFDVSAINLNALRKREGWSTGRTGQFQNGSSPHNKGRKCAPGTGGNHPNARATQFRKGERQGVAVALYQPIGAERISKDGYRERKIHDGLPAQSRWRTVQRIEWEAANGPLPAGHALKCIDGNRINTDPSNWVAVPRAILPRLNGGRAKKQVAFDAAALELKPTILAVARLEHRVRQIKT